MMKPADLREMAHRTAEGVKKGQKQARAVLPERQQLARYRERLKKGAEGFADILEQQGPNGLQRYLAAMIKLEKKLEGVQGKGGA